MTRAGWIIVATVVLAAAAAGVWAASSLADAKQAAADAAADTADCRQLAGRIAAGRHASPTTGPGEPLGPRLARAAEAADLGEDAVARVAPQPARPGGRRSTQIALQRVTLRQALSFVGALVGGGGPTLESFHLTVPAAEAGGANATAVGDDEWDVDLSVVEGGR